MDVIAATIVFLLFISLSSLGRTIGTPIRIGASLKPTPPSTQWPSASGLFAFGFYPQGTGFAVGIWLVGRSSSNSSRTVTWTANRDDPPVTSSAKLVLTAKGILLRQTEQEPENPIANPNETVSYASMLDSGNFVLYSQNSRIIWQSFDHPTDTLLGGQSLPCTTHLFSSSSNFNTSTGQFRLDMQGDGDLVLYPANTLNLASDSYWATGTWKIGSKYNLYLNTTGHLFIGNDSYLDVVADLYNEDLSWANNNEKHTIYRATLDSDGLFRFYVHVDNGSGIDIDNPTVLSRWPDDACSVKGFCGFNSYCTFNDENEQPYCHCLPGFDFKDANDEKQGCQRNFSEAECGDEKNVALYSIQSMENILWGDRPYFVAQTTKEECSSSCSTDCNCGAALYQEGMCMKQEPPLRYVRRKKDSEAPSTAFLKVGKKSLKSSPIPEPPHPSLVKSTSNKAKVQIILVTSIFTVLLCASIAVFIHLIYKIRVLRYKKLLEIGNMGLNEEVTLRIFSYNELKRATNNFKEELGKGSFGAVYKGTLYKGRRLIAVKRLEKLVEEGEREFQAEMRAIGKTHHRNLVRLLGYCAEGSKRLLVYEYMSNGSVGTFLFGAVRRPDWDERVRIALDIARGILYLHEECEAPIIHCDIKPQNILMDEFWTAKISDFGLAKLLMPDQTRTFTGVRGTRGYVAPEWHKNTPITVKADVYSYGIVLLEIVCCRRNLDVNVSEPGEIVLSNWAYKCFIDRELNKLVLWEAVDKNVLENMVKVAFWCIQEEPVLRPTMKSVVLMLEGVTEVAIPPCPTDNSM